ncbi:MAG TPA: hypothetical protein VFR86_16030 [Burkholderiaceae bacterium]|nr:hypothetical protein [Burkholderiaceae bacterium]
MALTQVSNNSAPVVVSLATDESRWGPACEPVQKQKAATGNTETSDQIGSNNRCLAELIRPYPRYPWQIYLAFDTNSCAGTTEVFRHAGESRHPATLDRASLAGTTDSAMGFGEDQ